MRQLRAAAAWIAVPLLACASSPRIPAVRFENEPPVRAVNDRLDVRVEPAERIFDEALYHYDGTVQRRLSRALELPRSRRALGVNSFDEVPDSTWFTNRIGVRELSTGEITAGPITLESPELHKPWTIHSTKTGGTELGFIFSDARGERFLLKFDPQDFPELETATHVIVDRLLWACGYNTTEDFIVRVRREDLLLAADAYEKDVFGRKAPLARAALERRLAGIAAAPDGTIRALASRWVPGKPIGGHPAEGVRTDDPNDRIPHELRRDLRGFFAIAAWLDHVDIQESNFLDSWVADARDPHRHYVKHYLLDFGKSLGGMATTKRDPRSSYEYVVDFAEIGRSLFTAGILERTWESRRAPPLRGVGIFDAASFDPGAWKPNSPAYVPFLNADRFDNFWAAKIVMRFSPAQIRAAVEAARLSDPRATEYLIDMLIARQRATGAYWFSRVAPLDRFAMAGDSLCFDDLMLVYGLGASALWSSYTVRTYDRQARPVGGPFELHSDPWGRACTPELPLGGGRDAYTIAEIELRRPGFSGRTLVHLARGPAGAPRVIGIWRP